LAPSGIGKGLLTQAELDDIMCMEWMYERNRWVSRSSEGVPLFHKVPAPTIEQTQVKAPGVSYATARTPRIRSEFDSAGR
jgi:hypothetical protein